MFANRKIENIENEVLTAISVARKQQPLLNAMVSFTEVDEAIEHGKILFGEDGRSTHRIEGQCIDQRRPYHGQRFHFG
jgi:hypothetical protein